MSFSAGSRTSKLSGIFGKYPPEQLLDDMTDLEMINVVHELNADTRRLEIENQVFENFIIANETSLIAGMEQILETAMKLNLPALIGLPGTSASPTESEEINVRASTQSREERGPRINFSLKTDLVMREIEMIQTSLEKLLATTHKKKALLKAEIEESYIRAQEVQDTRNAFEQVFIIGAVQKITQRIPAEKFVRYMQEWLTNAQFMVEKLRMRTNSLRTHQWKLRSTLNQKEELGESVHEVDFEKLKIENKNFIISIEQKNKHLLELKQINGRASLMLTNHKNLLLRQDLALKCVKRTIKTIQKRIVDLTDETASTKEEVEQEKERYKRLKKCAKQYEVPPVMTYIKKKNELNDLHKTLKVWRRKTNIQRIALSTYTKMMMQLTGAKIADKSWYIPSKSQIISRTTTYEDVNKASKLELYLEF